MIIKLCTFLLRALISPSSAEDDLEICKAIGELLQCRSIGFPISTTASQTGLGVQSKIPTNLGCGSFWEEQLKEEKAAEQLTRKTYVNRKWASFTQCIATLL